MHTDVTAKYLGLDLRSPLIVGACPMTMRPETVRELTIAGVGAVVLPSLQQQQVVGEMPDCVNRACCSQPRLEQTNSVTEKHVHVGGFDSYMGTIAVLKQNTGIPILANLSGQASGNWLQVASEIAANGVDAIELSFQLDLSDPSSSADAVESQLIHAVESLCDAVSIPVSVKLLPFFTSLPNLARRLAEAGAAGIVIFGREPVWEVRGGALAPSTHWQLSQSGQFHTTLSGLMRVRGGDPAVSIAASGGISTTKEVVQAVIAGADVAMVTSELYRTGPDGIAHILEGIVHYLNREGFESFHAFTADRARAASALPPTHSELGPMTRPRDYLNEHAEPVRKTGDRWGHPLPSPLDD